MRRACLVWILCLVAVRAEARVQPVDQTGTWEVADRSGARVTITWADTTAVQLDFGRGRYGVAFRELDAYVGVAQADPGEVVTFRITGLGDGEVLVAWRASWTSPDERAERWVASHGSTTLFDGLPTKSAAAPLPAFGAPVAMDREPEVLWQSPAEYPAIAREAGVEGVVVVQVLVGRSGGVRDVRVMKSIPMLDAAAVASVKRWSFEPARYGGKRVAAWTEVKVPFKLK